MKVLLYFATLPLLLTALSGAPTSLAPQWEMGKTLNYVIECGSTAKSTSGDEFIELSQTLKLDTSWEVQKISEHGSVELGVRIERVRFSADGKGAAAMVRNLRFDSKAKDETRKDLAKSVGDILMDYVGPASTVTMDAHGELTGFSAAEDLAKAVDSAMAAELSGFFGNLFRVEGIQEYLTLWLVAVPEAPAPHGHTWKQEVRSPFGGNTMSVRNYKLIEPAPDEDGSFLRIDLTSEIKEGEAPDEPEGKPPGEGSPPEHPRKIEFDNREGSGMVHLDKETRLICKFVSKQDATMKVSFLDIDMDLADTRLKSVYSATLQRGEPAPDPDEAGGSD